MPFYHVRIWQKTPNSAVVEVSLDLTREDLESKFLAPYRKGLSIMIKGKPIPIENLDRIRITTSEKNAEQLRPLVKQRHPRSRSLVIDQHIAEEGEDVTDDFITKPPGSEIEPALPPNQGLMPPTDAREVFIVHGRNLAARDALFAFLRAIDLHPLEWAEAVRSTGRTSPYIGDILNAAFSRAHAVVVLMTPDDDAQLRVPLRSDSDPPHETELTGQARPNVLFEAGMAMGRNEDRTILVELGTLRPFSDVAGRHVIRIDNTTQRRQDLAHRLQAAGCPAKLDGTDWHTAGNFEAALELTAQMPSESTATLEQPSTNAETLQLSEAARNLLIEGAQGSGTILNADHRDIDRRSKAARDNALAELTERGLVEDRSGKRTLFGITHKGFEVADELTGT